MKNTYHTDEVEELIKGIDDILSCDDDFIDPTNEVLRETYKKLTGEKFKSLDKSERDWLTKYREKLERIKNIMKDNVE